MMEIEMPKMQPSQQQDMDLIDILWRQDIDLGAGREVFDFTYRQKESELQKQKEQEEEKRQQLQLEQEKALLAQLQLDEETGEFVPRPNPSSLPPQPGTTPSTEVNQNDVFSEGNGDAMSFDECMQLLAETFPLVEPTETTPPCLESSVSTTTDSSQLMMATEQPAPTQNAMLPASLDQAWMELLSIPELQQCLNMIEPPAYVNTNVPVELQDPNYNMYMAGLTDLAGNNAESCQSEYVNGFERSFPNMALPNLDQMSLTAPDVNSGFGTEGLCDVLYSDLDVNSAENGASPLADTANDPPMDLHALSPGDTFNTSKAEAMVEFPDSDSGLSLDSSPNVSSPDKSLHDDGSFEFSDAEMDDMDNDPGSVESDFMEMFSLSLASDCQQTSLSVQSSPAHHQDMQGKHSKSESMEGSGHTKPPFTKDKAKRRSEARLSRDEQRAKALQIPFTVDMIVNLPVDDFNEMMSKHQLNEAQLALVRDIRRRGKNKVAAQNCRKRKMESILGLEYDLDSLKEEKERLQKEKTENSRNLRQMKQQLNALYLEVFSVLRDEQGRPYSPGEYSLQQTSDGSVFLVPRVKKTLVKSDNR
ncbi:nuclear factor erythroid 2-related factor 2a [Chanos chanos]|uniref:Nuclear factor erythroid 2-related factor 2a n=1 Tax=Chanos chanos TaxID=29144 RepID=A0A6J2WFV1_CHACN|nr:nuclear factor erythroid 2-related factor 2 [Chanos chanos]